MPNFEEITLEQARAKTVTGKRAQVQREYVGYIEAVREGHAGTLKPAEGETTNAIRRRLGAAATALGKTMRVRTVDGIVYFWAETGNGRRRGRKPQSAQ